MAREARGAARGAMPAARYTGLFPALHLAATSCHDAKQGFLAGRPARLHFFSAAEDGQHGEYDTHAFTRRRAPYAGAAAPHKLFAS